jgi:peptide deformylase
MSEILIIDTATGITQEHRLDPLPLFDENHPMLKIPIPEYTQPLPNPIMTNLVKRLTMTRKLYGGIGLSANQCGVFERVFVIGTDHFDLACINPKLIEASVDVLKMDEGCLSYPGLCVKIDRPIWVQVEFTDEKGQTKQTRLDGLSARCFLHELDHMNGKRFIEYVGPVALQIAKRKQEKMLKKVIRHRKKTNDS